MLGRLYGQGTMTAVFSVDVDPATLLRAAKTAPITVPLFDPVYAITGTGLTFSRSSPWPHFMNDFRLQSNGAVTYENSQVLTPFGVSTLTRGSTGSGSPSGNAKATFYADKDMVLSSGGLTENYHANNTLAVGGGIQTLGNAGAPFDATNVGTTPVYRGFEPYFIWNRLIQAEWLYGQLAVVLDFLTLDAASNDCDAMMPFPLVSGDTPDFAYGAFSQNFFAWRSVITSHILRLTNAFSNGIGKNIYAVELNTTFSGTSLFLFSFDSSLAPAGSSSNLNALTFDDANIQALINAGNYELQGTNFGWLISWSKGTYELIKGQGVQSILLTTAVDPQGNRIYAPSYAPILLQPRTTKAANMSGLSNIADMKIDPNGILYMRSTGGGSDPTYVANSQGLDLSIPGITIDASKLTGNLALPSFCPCSPVAVPVGGA